MIAAVVVILLLVEIIQLAGTAISRNLLSKR
jgi:ABC-type methionine transport system permease subunit